MLRLVSLVSVLVSLFFFFFESRRRHTRLQGDWSSDVCSSDLDGGGAHGVGGLGCMPEVGQHVDAAPLDLGGFWGVVPLFFLFFFFFSGLCERTGQRPR